MTTFRIFVINLDRSGDRLDRMAAQLDGIGVDWTRMPAIEPGLVKDHPSYSGRLARAVWGRDLHRGELGCFLSHLACIDAFLGSDAATMIAFEDDVIVDGAAMRMIEGLPDLIAASGIIGWQCVNLSSRYAKRRSLVRRIGEFGIYRAWQFPLLTSALLWSREGATAFRDSVRRSGIFMPVDNQLRAVMTAHGRGLSLDPPPVGLAYFPSTIVDVVPTKRRTHRLSLRGLLQSLPLYASALFHMARGR